MMSTRSSVRIAETQLGAAREFIARHRKEIDLVLTGDSQLKSKLPLEELGTRTCADILTQFSTQILIHNKSPDECNAGAKHVLLSFADPGSVEAIGPLIPLLLADRRCTTISLFGHGAGLMRVLTSLSKEFVPIESMESKVTVPLHMRLAQLSECTPVDPSISSTMVPNRPLDTVVVAPSFTDGPERSLLYTAKSRLGAKNIFVVLDGWGGAVVNHVPLSAAVGETLDTIDGIFTNDAGAERLMQGMHDGCVSYTNSYSIGTPQFENCIVSEAKRETARLTLGLKDSELAILYSGMPSQEEAKMSPSLELGTNGRSWNAVVTAAIQCATQNATQQYVVLYRGHPRDTKDGVEKISATLREHGYTFGVQQNNLRFISASMDVIADGSIVLAAADATVGIASTMVFMDYSTKHLPQATFTTIPNAGLEVFNTLYGTIFDKVEGHFPPRVASIEDLAKCFGSWKVNSAKKQTEGQDIGKRMLDIILQS